MPADALDNLLHAVSQRSTAFARAEKSADTLGISHNVSNTFPRALVLVVVECHCETCGTTSRSVNNCLVRYDREGFQNASHHRRLDLAPYLALPREIKLHQQHTPFCELCFIDNHQGSAT